MLESRGIVHSNFEAESQWPIKVEKAKVLSVTKDKAFNFKILCFCSTLTLSYWGEGDFGGAVAYDVPSGFSFHHPETPQAIRLKLSDFKDTSLRHILRSYQFVTCELLQWQ